MTSRASRYTCSMVTTCWTPSLSHSEKSHCPALRCGGSYQYKKLQSPTMKSMETNTAIMLRKVRQATTPSITFL